MFEITGNDIANLNDVDLRDLVRRLAIAELRRKGYPRSSVTAGGNQDAADGGLDVRVDCPSEIVDPDFVPNRLTGFQVKKPDMPTKAIQKEMRPNGKLRDVVQQLADASGAYVIVSAQGSVADKPLEARRNAMRAALGDLPTAAQLHTDFYDRDRLATWVDEYPGIAAWVRTRVGRSLSGWSGINDWEGRGDASSNHYLTNETACLIDERSRDRKHLTVGDGIVSLRELLRTPRSCVRLIGLSGVGKTRLVQALFEEGVGDTPLDSSLAVYTDYSSETTPSARDMARDLVAHGQRAILIVDNCNPATHGELAPLCSSEASKVSLITVEYDVRDDEPELTQVFRLESSSSKLVSEWIEQTFPDVSQVDRGRISEFSNGNFRVARALAETVGKGETIGSLKSTELFERIFHQRKEPDRQLLHAAEDLSLLYSIDGDNAEEDGELACVARLRNVDPTSLYEALVELRRRGIVQARGCFRAILPQAIANPLAARALERLPSTRFDNWCRTLPERMLKSLSRRLGLLHESSAAQTVVERWLRPDGPLGDLIGKNERGFEIVANIAPVTPKGMLARFQAELDGPTGTTLSAPTAGGRHQWIRLIRVLAYDADLFDTAVVLLARFAPSESDESNLNSAFHAFSGLFHLSLSGTKALPEQRRAAIRRFAASTDDGVRRCARIALRAMLEGAPFMSNTTFEFGARPRDWGWHPQFNGEIWDWYSEAITLALEVATDADARILLANAVRTVWGFPPCRKALDRAASVFAQKSPWIDGWIALRATFHYDGEKMPEAVRTELEKLIDRLKPRDLLSRARAVVVNRMNRGWDFEDGEERERGSSKVPVNAERLANEIGRVMANDAAARAVFIPELMTETHSYRVFEFGRGLADGALDLSAMWDELVGIYTAADPKRRSSTVLGGFICDANERDPKFTSDILEQAIGNLDLLPELPYLQARAGLDMEGLERLRRALTGGKLSTRHLYSIANGSVANSPALHLALLLNDLAKRVDGIPTALEILHMHFYAKHDEDSSRFDPQLISVGRDLLCRIKFDRTNPINDFGAANIIRISLDGEVGRETAATVCANLRSALEAYNVSSYDLIHTLRALFETQPFVALDTFVLFEASYGLSGLFDVDSVRKGPIESLGPVVLHQWAEVDPKIRYPLIGNNLRMFVESNGEPRVEICPLFLAILQKAPDKGAFLGNSGDRVVPQSYSGSLADILVQRKAQLKNLAEHPDEHIRTWVDKAMPDIDRWIASDRVRERAREESFE